jgi:Flp pilus assembly protein TadG
MSVSRLPGLLSAWRRFARDTRGTSAVELVLCLTFLTLPILNVINLGFYAYERTQLESAAQSAVQMAWHTCDLTHVPTANCSGAATAMLGAAQSATTLGTNVTMPASAIVEGYYCSNGSGALTRVGTLGSTTAAPTSVPATCTSVVTGSTAEPGDYIQATASAPYTPLFNSVSLFTLPSTISRTAWLRLN